jgi:hypothetical protein
MSKVVSLPFVLLAIALTATTILAQDIPATDGHAFKRSATRSWISRAQAFHVTSELNRQQKFLNGVASRYEAVSAYDFTPLLNYSYVWNALRENRARLGDPRRRMTPDQSRLLADGYDLLESDILLLFLDHQLNVLTETLELTEMQSEEVHKTLAEDLSGKQALVAAKGINAKLFGLRINALSQQTEKKILSILYPEQRKKFEKQVTFNKDRLVG